MPKYFFFIGSLKTGGGGGWGWGFERTPEPPLDPHLNLADIPACIQTIRIDPSDLQAQLYTSIDEIVGSLQSVKKDQMSMRKCFQITLSKEEQQALGHSSLANGIRQFKERLLKRTSGIKGLNLMEQVLS